MNSHTYTARASKPSIPNQRVKPPYLESDREASSEQSTYPDIDFIKRRIPIRDLARKLRLSVKGYRAHCWRPENHQHGDADPSVTFNMKMNRGRCWVCDSRSWSTLDLVLLVLGCETREAVEWVAARYFVPEVSKGRHVTRSAHPPLRVGTNGFPPESLILSGLWATLNRSEQAILPVLQQFADPTTGIAEISYRGIMRYAGVGSASTVSKALKHFKQLHLLWAEGRPGPNGLRACSRYSLTFDDERFLRLLNEIHRQQRAEVEVQRALQANARRHRRGERKAQLPVKVKPLSTGWSAGRFDTTANGVA